MFNMIQQPIHVNLRSVRRLPQDGLVLLLVVYHQALPSEIHFQGPFFFVVGISTAARLLYEGSILSKMWRLRHGQLLGRSTERFAVIYVKGFDDGLARLEGANR